MAEAVFYNGNPFAFGDYTPGAAVSAGQVVVLVDLVAIAHTDIAANEKGALALGGGVYTCTCELAINQGDTVYWDDTTNKVDKTNTNKKIGYALTTTAAADLAIQVLHLP